MAPSFKIGVDIDGVIAGTDDIAYLKYCENNLGWNINYDEFFSSHSWNEATGKTSLEMAEAFREFLHSDKESQRIIPGALDALSKISLISEIFLITSRRDILRESTEHFVGKYLSDISEIKLSMDNHYDKTPRLVEYELDYFIDDSHTEISKILGNKSLNTKIIPFPTFHVQPDWSTVKNDERIIWLDIWKEVKPNLHGKEKEKIQVGAWNEIQQTIWGHSQI